MKKTSPAWTIPSKHPSLKIERTPSPAVYRPESWKNDRAPAWKIGKADRSKVKASATPGPGLYQTNISTNSKKLGKFGLQSYHKNRQQMSPSPQSYNPNFSYTMPSSPNNKFNQSKRQHKKCLTPGPGAYEQSPNKSVKSSKIGKQERFSKSIAIGPDPATYQPINDWFKQISVTFAKSQRDQKNKQQSPGPSSYNHQTGWLSIHTKNKGYTMGCSIKRDKQNLGPGPTDYSPSTSFIMRQSEKITMSPKFKSKTPALVPGPSDYNKEWIGRKQPQYSIGKQKKDRSTYSTSPGPGCYQVTNRKTSPSFSLSGSRLKDPKFITPGPGAYQADKNKLKNRPQSATIGNSKRLNSKTDLSPGPADYQPYQRTKMVKTCFGKQRKDVLKLSNTPGPGAYQNPTTIGNFR